MTRRTAALLGALGLAVLLVGCTPAADGGGPTDTPTPDSSAPAAGSSSGGDLDAAWLDGGRSVGVLTVGSSNCVPTAVVGPYIDGAIEISLLDDPEAVCSADLASRVTLVDLPSEVDRTQELEIVVTGETVEGTVTLPGLADADAEGPSDQLPSAGWTTTPNTFIVLLWGSSGCPEFITAAEVTGETAITAPLSGVPADTACTADVVPNPQIAIVDGELSATGVELTLTSAAADPYTTPILGVTPGSGG